jgi:hypothetical protein
VRPTGRRALGLVVVFVGLTLGGVVGLFLVATSALAAIGRPARGRGLVVAGGALGACILAAALWRGWDMKEATTAADICALVALGAVLGSGVTGRNLANQAHSERDQHVDGVGPDIRATRT